MSIGFRGAPFVFQSPSNAVAGMVSRLCPVPGAQSIALADARGRVLAEPAHCDRDSPAFDHSAMDGYAVCAGHVAAGAPIAIEGESRIGHAPPALRSSAGAVRISTGAPMPPGADAVLKREDVHADERSLTVSLELLARLKPGLNVRRRGENARSGEVVMQPGVVLSASGIGTLAAVGCATPRVRDRVRVAVIATGDELTDPRQEPGPFQVRDSNGPAVCAVLASNAWVHVASVHHVPDDPDLLRSVLQSSTDTCDAVVLTGGVSMGHRDPVREAVERVGGEVIFHGLPQRPGKPMLGGVARGVPLFGLPGNPVSAMVTCVRIVVPVLAARAGCTSPMTCADASGAPWAPRVALSAPDDARLDLWWHRLVRLTRDGQAELLDARGSGDIAAGGRSDGFIEVPPRGWADDAADGRFSFYPWPT